MYTLQTVEHFLKSGIDAELLCFPVPNFEEAKTPRSKSHSSKFADIFTRWKLKKKQIK
jgi:hypothetical protein